MNSREQFETWMRSQPHVLNLGRHLPNGKYVLPEDETAWQSWQASRACATPEWEHAPEWAQWLAMNPDGHWYWFAAPPELRLAQWWNPWGSKVKDAGLTPGRTDWAETLEQRP